MVRGALRCLLIGLFLQPAWLSSAIAQEDLWKGHVTAGAEAYRLEDLLEAERQFRAAVAVAEEFGAEDLRLAMSLDYLAALYHDLDRSLEAERLYSRSLAIVENALGRYHPFVAQSLDVMAKFYCDRGRHSIAEPLYQRALTIRQQALPSGHPDVVRSMDNYVAVLRRTGQTAKADEIDARAKAFRTKPADEQTK